MPTNPTHRVDPRAAQRPPLTAARAAANAYYRADDPRDQAAAAAALGMFYAIVRMPSPSEVELARHRVVSAIEKLRFSGGVSTGPRPLLTVNQMTDEATWLTDIATWLDAYAQVLADRCDAANRVAENYADQTRDIEAMRRVLGIGS